MYARKISLKITSLAIAAIGLLGTVSTLDLIKNNIPTTFAQPTPTTTNNTQGTVSTSPFKPGIAVMPMTCTTPNDLFRSLGHLAGNNTIANSAIAQMMKNQMITTGGTNKNMTASHLKQALNMEICFPSTFPLLQQNLSGKMLSPPLGRAPIGASASTISASASVAAGCTGEQTSRVKNYLLPFFTQSLAFCIQT